ncbi:HET-domain-containing protein [Hyaloscypha hepaticicola]|uniref:HET-domain-containing protein n=1 Tax=Hyaloscypha hepaticicola TaxID=2082293 RepID=A0A2J6PQP9_9HELO|nr:HET-domain-containing protein [Hyaloscypha hepaticicola]
MDRTCASCKVIHDGSQKYGVHHDLGVSLVESRFLGCQLCTFLWDNLTEEEQDLIIVLDLIRLYDAREQGTSGVYYHPVRGYAPTRSTTHYVISGGVIVDGYSLTYRFLGPCRNPFQPELVKTFSFPQAKGTKDLGRKEFTTAPPSSSALASSPGTKDLGRKEYTTAPPSSSTLASSPGTKDLGREEYTTAPPSSSALALKWLTTCDNDHTKCKATGKKDLLPSRLIDVGDKSSGDPSLLITADVPKPLVGAKYLTLSHCWGDIKIKRLEKANLEDMKKAIVMSSLPQTFQDAIRVTRELGQRYLWIDSLCIIQDSEEDWFQESSRMGDIYSNSYCTISATGAEDGSMGLFLDHKPPPVPKSSLDTGAPNHDTKMWEREVDSAPLNQRAWVFQERFLSHRNLMFSRNCLFWECDSNRASETFPDSLPSWMTSTTQFKFSGEAALGRVGNIGAPYKPADDSDGATDVIAKRAWFLMLTGAQLPVRFEGNNGNFAKGGDGAPNAYRYWNNIVEEYSKKNLTKETDRLIALYGIAQSIKQQYTHDEYVAGMWKNHLLNQLLWMTYTNLKKARPEYRAPSWSWASVIGKLMFRDILETEELGGLGAKVVEVSVDTTKAKEGEVRGGYLEIRGKIFTGTWKVAGRHKEVSNGEKNEKVPLWSEEHAAIPTNTYSMKMGDSGRLNNLMGYPDVEEEGFESGETVCLAIQKREKPAKTELDKAWSVIVDGLVLKRDKSDKLQRIGIFNAAGDGARSFLDRAEEAVVQIF